MCGLGLELAVLRIACCTACVRHEAQTLPGACFSAAVDATAMMFCIRSALCDRRVADSACTEFECTTAQHAKMPYLRSISCLLF